MFDSRFCEYVKVESLIPGMRLVCKMSGEKTPAHGGFILTVESVTVADPNVFLRCVELGNALEFNLGDLLGVMIG